MVRIMKKQEILEVVNLTINLLSEIENRPINEDVKEELISKVLKQVIKPKTQKYASGNQKKVVESLRELGGKAIRADIIAESGIEPNLVSALLSRLVKQGKVKKIELKNKDLVSIGTGLNPRYIYKLIENDKH